jgi:hypothetical protein
MRGEGEVWQECKPLRRDYYLLKPWTELSSHRSTTSRLISPAMWHTNRLTPPAGARMSPAGTTGYRQPGQVSRYTWLVAGPDARITQSRTAEHEWGKLLGVSSCLPSSVNTSRLLEQRIVAARFLLSLSFRVVFSDSSDTTTQLEK